MEITPELLADARKRNKLVEHDEEIQYVRFKEDFRSIPRGTVIVTGKKIVWGFPHIKRIFTLEKGIEKNIKSDVFYVEEKIDGYNVRIAQIDGKLFAFSRGGFIEPFATEKISDMGFERFFHDYPEYVLCGEMIGNTPYTPPTNEFDVKLFIFDIDCGGMKYLNPKEKYDLLKKYNIESVPVIGSFKKDEIAKLKESVLSILERKAEGIVIKSADRSDVVKFVTPAADLEDVARNMPLMFDMPSGFFIQRVLRSAFFIKDFQLDQRNYAQRLGAACYDSFIEKLKEIEKGGVVSEEFEVLLKNPSTWQQLLKHISRDIKIEIISKKVDDNGIRIRFRKIYKKTNKRLRDFLSGKGITD
jgi:putative ATP-dependent DNA ligase